MTDRDMEKVITGLELCTDISQDGCMMLCPYRNEQDETYSGFCEQVLKRDALTLLKEQDKKGTWRDYEGMLKCSVCGAEFYREIMEYCGDKVPHFCPDCGAEMVGV